MDTLAVLVALTLVAIAVLHLAWGSGLCWPARDQQSLINTVIGHPDVTRMPGFVLCAAVAFALLAAAFWALWGTGLVSGPEVSLFGIGLRDAGLWALVLIFASRGLASYLPSPLANAVEPFRTLDRSYYAPLCLLFALAFLAIAVRAAAA